MIIYSVPTGFVGSELSKHTPPGLESTDGTVLDRQPISTLRTGGTWGPYKTLTSLLQMLLSVTVAQHSDKESSL